MVVQPCCEVRGEVVSAASVVCAAEADGCGGAVRDERNDVEVETSGCSSAVVCAAEANGCGGAVRDERNDVEVETSGCTSAQ